MKGTVTGVFGLFERDAKVESFVFPAGGFLTCNFTDVSGTKAVSCVALSIKAPISSPIAKSLTLGVSVSPEAMRNASNPVTIDNEGDLRYPIKEGTVCIQKIGSNPKYVEQLSCTFKVASKPSNVKGKIGKKSRSPPPPLTESQKVEKMECEKKGGEYHRMKDIDGTWTAKCITR